MHELERFLVARLRNGGNRTSVFGSRISDSNQFFILALCEFITIFILGKFDRKCSFGR
jgi:hypothetical protein